jgi:hypothetical protein
MNLKEIHLSSTWLSKLIEGSLEVLGWNSLHNALLALPFAALASFEEVGNRSSRPVRSAYITADGPCSMTVR